MPSKVNLLNQVFGRLTVTSKAEKVDGRTAWTCKCECGEIRNILAQSLRKGATKSCGCLWRDVVIQKYQKKAGELIGKVFGRWTVKNILPRRAKNGGIYFNCLCECGSEREVSSDTLLGGRSSSCGLCAAKQKPFCLRGHEVIKWGGRTPSGACKGCLKSKALLREYGLTIEEYARLWEYQKGLCAICGKSLGIMFEIEKQGFGRSGRAEVDHQHGTDWEKKKTVRGLLCGGRWAGCNRKIGRIDKPDWLRLVLAYLDNPPAREIFKDAA